MQIVFWNTARGSDVKGDRLSLITANLEAIADRIQPELIVLCELQEQSVHWLTFQNGVRGYTFVTPLRQYGDYGKPTTLRYGILVRNGSGAVANLVSTGTHRPAVHIVIDHLPVLAIHAPSVTHSINPQSDALYEAIGWCGHLQEPMVIFGDFNVDALNNAMRQGFAHLVSAHLLHFWGVFNPVIQRYPNHPTRPKSGKALDWALANPHFGRQVDVSIVPTDAPQPVLTVLSEGDYRPEIISTDKSDHEAILIDIT